MEETSDYAQQLEHLTMQITILSARVDSVQDALNMFAVSLVDTLSEMVYNEGATAISHAFMTIPLIGPILAGLTRVGFALIKSLPRRFY